MEKTDKRGKISRRVRLVDLAKRCEVSVSTVSRALAHEKGVRPEIRERVLEAAREYNYAMPGAVAGQKVIIAASSAAMIDYVRNQFTAHVLEGVRERAAVLGLEVVTRPVSSADEERMLLEEALEDEAIAGLLFLTLDDEEMLAPTRDFAKPVVLVNGDDPFMRLSSVAPCNRAAAAMGTEYLRRLGHERILFLMRRGRRTIERRFEGWRDAMGPDAELAELVVEVDDWLPELAAEAIAARLDRQGLDFSAVLAAGDSLAVGAAMGLSSRGVAVPEAVSVMGMDDLPQAAFHTPPLTTIHIPMREIGAAALDLLRDQMVGFSAPARRIELACGLVERASVGRPAGA
ncbi:LacI family transcriptional regulator [Pelagibacterium sp. HS1C4-1]|nr:LacI family transcriptional regulator [Pelagibacterium xiamenense]